MSLGKFISKYTYQILLFIFLSILSNLVMLSLIPLSKKLPSIFIEKSLDNLYNLALLVIVVYFFKGLFFYLQNMLASYISIKVTSDLRTTFYNHFLKTKYINIENKKNEEIIFPLSNDLIKIKDVIFSTLSEFVPSLILLIFSISYSFYINWQLFLLVIVLIPSISLILSYTNKFIDKQSLKIQSKSEDIIGYINQNIINYKIVKNFNFITFNNTNFTNKDSDLNKESFKLFNILSLQPAFIGLVQTTGISIIVCYGGYQVINAYITLENLISFGTSLSLTVEPAIFITKSLGIIAVSKVSIKRFFNLIDTFTLEDEKKLYIDDIKTIEVENLSFKYESDLGEKNITISNLNFIINSGDWIYISGENGSGKSTLIKLLLGFYLNYQGQIRFNSEELKNINLNSLYKCLKASFHESYLFSGSLKDNIMIGFDENRDCFSIDDISSICLLKDFVDDFNNLFDYDIGEFGNKLSTGQKQRVSLARAIISKPKVLILDEASSAIDHQSEKIIYENIKEYLPETIVILINHRKGADLFCNKVVYLK